MTANRHQADVVREYVPLDEGRIHGVTFDGERVWFARDDELVAIDPNSGRVLRRIAVPGANAGTAFDGEHLYQLAKGKILVIDPADGRVLRQLLAPGNGEDSGMAWADGHLWIGQYRSAKIYKVSAATGEIVSELASDRYVTGVSCLDGALWHATSETGKPCELRRLEHDGTVAETLTVPVASIAGMEAVRGDTFWCAGEQGTLRLIRKRA